MPFDLYTHCSLCPRRCGANRSAGDTGFCGQTDQCRVAATCRHFGEEPSFAGTRGSGTIFFSGCACRCFFCQNHQISRENIGRPVSSRQLFELAMALVQKGVHNLNFVTPDHFWPHIKTACIELRNSGVTIPFIYNCSGYALPEQIDQAADLIDIFLPDFKFAAPDLARTCMKDRHYPEIALAAIRRMVNARGFLTPWDPSGQKTARTGVLVRHLVLPGQTADSLDILSLLYREFGPELPLSVMSQFYPTPACHDRHLFTRPLPLTEYDRVCRHIEDLGFERVYIQPESGDEAFLPDFTKDRPFAGNEDLENSI